MKTALLFLSAFLALVCIAGEAFEIHRLRGIVQVLEMSRPTGILIEREAEWSFYCVPGTACSFGHDKGPINGIHEPTLADGCTLVAAHVANAKRVYACQ